jgi:hypothetical protein
VAAAATQGGSARVAWEVTRGRRNLVVMHDYFYSVKHPIKKVIRVLRTFKIDSICLESSKRTTFVGSNSPNDATGKAP